MKRILYLTPGCFDKGGISRYGRYEITAYRELLGDVGVRVLSVLGPDESAFEESFSVSWHGRTNDVRSKVGFVLRAVSLALRWRPDVIHVAHLHYAGLARALARACGCSSVVNVYGLEVWTDPPRAALWGLKGVDVVVSDCHFTAGYIRDSNLRTKPIKVIWDCVDTTRFSPGAPDPAVYKKYGIPQKGDGVNVLTLGRMTKDARHKGFERLLEAFTRVAAKASSLRLIYAGRGDLRVDLEAIADRNGLSNRVHFTGAIDENDLADVYRTAHFFALVSDRGHGRGEGIPLTPLEAAACGLPIIVGNQDGSQEAVDDGNNGFIVNPDDVQMLADKLLELAGDAKTRELMSTAAVAKVLRDFEYSKFRKDHEVLLNELRTVRADA